MEPIFRELCVRLFQPLGVALQPAQELLARPLPAGNAVLGGQRACLPLELFLRERRACAPKLLVELRYRDRRDACWRLQHPTAAAPGSSRTARRSFRRETAVS